MANTCILSLGNEGRNSCGDLICVRVDKIRRLLKVYIKFSAFVQGIDELHNASLIVFKREK